MADVKSTCKCGATFNASGASYVIGWRFREWLEAHERCLEKEEK